MKHLFEEKAFVYQAVRQLPKMLGYHYDSIKGYWINSKTNISFIHESNGLVGPTKKCDMETGEDRKGE